MTPPAPAPETSRLRLEYVDGVRALAALIVYLNHAYAQVTYGDYFQLKGPWALTKYSMVAGHLSVTVFIVISGFCLTLPVVSNDGKLRGGVVDFFKRRARRILPPYYAAVGLCLLLIWTIIGKPTVSLWDYPLQVSPFAIFSHLLVIQDLFATSRINYVFWSIAVEWHIYFLVPLLVLAWRRFGAAATVGGAMVLGYGLRFGFEGTRITRAHPQFLGMFALGMLAAYVVRSPEARYVRLRDKLPWGLFAALGLLVAVGLTHLWGVAASEGLFHLLDAPVGVMSASLLILVGRKPRSLLGRAFDWPPLVALGTFSYSFYLIHAPLLQVIWQYVLVPLKCSREAMLGWLLTLGLGAIALASYGFFRLFEAPFMGAARSVPSRKPEPEPAA